MRLGARLITRSTRVGSGTRRPASSVISRVAIGPSRAGPRKLHAQVSNRPIRTSAQIDLVVKSGANKKVPPTSPFLRQGKTGRQRDSCKPVAARTPLREVFRGCKASQAGLLASNIAEACSSQWRDRAGFSPASLFSPHRGTRTHLIYKDLRLRRRHTTTHLRGCQTQTTDDSDCTAL